MPELPEVEITRLAIAPFLEGKRVNAIVVRTTRLRYPVPMELGEGLTGQTILRVERRAKHLILRTTSGSVILHLGMSGSLDIVPSARPAQIHDHIDIVMETGQALRMNDPRRFGFVLWTPEEPLDHPLLRGVGPEPLGAEFNGDRLYRSSRGRTLAIKPFVMDSRIVAGVGNIYACECLFRAGIDPAKRAGAISRNRYLRLEDAIRSVLNEAIARGMNTLGDIGQNNSKTGYFPISPDVYGLGGAPCHRCGSLILKRRIVGRTTYFCGNCQK